MDYRNDFKLRKRGYRKIASSQVKGMQSVDKIVASFHTHTHADTHTHTQTHTHTHTHTHTFSANTRSAISVDSPMRWSFPGRKRHKHIDRWVTYVYTPCKHMNIYIYITCERKSLQL